MAYVWKHPKSPYWMACYKDRQGQWRGKTTRMRNRDEALAVAKYFESIPECWQPPIKRQPPVKRLSLDEILKKNRSRRKIWNISEWLRQSQIPDLLVQRCIRDGKLKTFRISRSHYATVKELRANSRSESSRESFRVNALLLDTTGKRAIGDPSAKRRINPGPVVNGQYRRCFYERRSSNPLGH